MHQPDLLSIFIDPLEKNGFDYFITGSIASTIFGEPRLTHDIDLVLTLQTNDIKKFISLFPSSHFYCPPEDIIRIELARKPFSHFNLIDHDSGYKADVYPYTGDPLHAWGFMNRQRIEINSEQNVWVAPPEYVIIRKLQYYREGGSEKHISDISKMLISDLVKIDYDILNEFIRVYDLQNQMEKVKSFRSMV